MSQSDFVPDQAKDAGMVKSGETGLPEQLASRMLQHLSKSNRFTPVDREALRRTVLEQRFGEKTSKTGKDKALNKAITDMENVNAQTVKEVGELADFNDLMKDFKDLGSAVKADYLVVGDMDRLEKKVNNIDVPYSERKAGEEVVNAVMRLRIVDVDKGTIIGAEDINTKLSEQLLMNPSESTGQYEMFEELAKKASQQIIDITFPAKIVKSDPLTVSRGRNSGVEEGTVFKIQRKGDPIKNEGLTIGHVKTEVGKVKVNRVQTNVSFVEPIEGNEFSQGDLAVLADNAKSGESQSQDQGTQITSATGQTESDQKPKIAVRLIKEGSTARTGPNKDDHTVKFTDTLISSLTETKRFDVLDRSEVDQLLDEQTAKALAQGEKLEGPMGSLSGADYLLYGNLSVFNIESTQTQLPGTSRTVTQNVGRVEGNMRIVNANSGKVRASEKISVKKNLKSSKGRQALETSLADAYSRKVVSLLMHELYPMKVAAVSDGTVYVNRGRDGGLEEGDVLEAMKTGEQVTDPQTGTVLGRTEEKIGEVVVTNVSDARSKATVESGDMPEQGYLLKKTDRNTQKAGKRETTGEKGVTEGPAKLVIGDITRNSSGRIENLAQGDIDRFVEELIVKLNNTNRFTVLDRQRLNQVLDQQSFNALVSGGNPNQKLRQLTDGDYIINGEISDFYTDRNVTEQAYTDEETVDVSGTARGIVRLVDIRTGEVVDAGEVNFSTEFDQDNSTRNQNHLFEQFSTRWVKNITNTLFPAKIIGKSSGVLYVNRGASAGMKSGTVYDLMRPGEQLTGVESDVSFGRTENKIGKVKITGVQESRSRAKLISGDQTVKEGDILRNPTQDQIEKESEQSEPVQDVSW